MAMKTSVYLNAEDKRRLAELARATGTSEAELLRRGVRLVLERAPRPRPRVGVASSTDRRNAAQTDDLLRETGFGEG